MQSPITAVHPRRVHSWVWTWVLSVAIVWLVGPATALAADRDRDGIPDARDRCPDKAEDFDGDADTDGCPDDRDSDGDGILDSKDLCPTLAEDVDGDADTDGCPDLKNDKDRDSIEDSQDVCPYNPEDHDAFEDSDGCPDPDNDGDKIADARDPCPVDAEDFDGFEDEDGCPDVDNDGDGIIDVSDSCPMEAEDMDGVEDDDGCPDVMVVVTDEKIELNDRIYFELNSSKLDPRSHPLLDEVASVLVDNAEIRVRIEGHTDDSGSDRRNLDLSDRRAKSVASYLIRQGVAPKRMIPIGFGERQPLTDNDTEEGRATNRRVEFFILERGS